MKFRYLREGILNKMGKVAGGMAVAGGALQAGKMAHNAIKPKEVSEYDDYDCDEGAAHVYGTALKTVSKMNPATKRKLANVAVAGTGIGAGLAMDQAGAISAMKKIKKSNESDYYDDFDEGIAGSAARAVGDTIRMASPKAKKLGAGVAALGATTGYCTAYGGKLSRKANGSNESDDYDCDEGVIGKTVKYGLAAGAALGAGKMARDAIKNRKTVSEYDDYDCDEGIGGAIKTGVTKLGSVIKSKAGAMKNSLKTDYISKGSALKVAAGTAAAGAAGGAVAGSKLASKRNESLAAAINGGRIPRRAKSVSVQESVNALQRYGIATKISREDSDVLFQRYNSVTYQDKIDALANIGFECRDDVDEPIAEVFIDNDYSIFLDAANQRGLVKASLIMPDGETAEYEVCDSAKSLEDFLKLCAKIVDRYA